MEMWYFWEQFEDNRCPYYPGCQPEHCTRCWENDPLDNYPKIKVQRIVTTTPSNPRLSRERVLSRLFSAIRKMPKAWGSRPWTSREIARAQSVVANDLYRRRVKRDYSSTPRV